MPLVAGAIFALGAGGIYGGVKGVHYLKVQILVDDLHYDHIFISDQEADRWLKTGLDDNRISNAKKSHMMPEDYRKWMKGPFDNWDIIGMFRGGMTFDEAMGYRAVLKEYVPEFFSSGTSKAGPTGLYVWFHNAKLSETQLEERLNAVKNAGLKMKNIGDIVYYVKEKQTTAQMLDWLRFGVEDPYLFIGYKISPPEAKLWEEDVSEPEFYLKQRIPRQEARRWEEDVSNSREYINLGFARLEAKQWDSIKDEYEKHLVTAEEAKVLRDLTTPKKAAHALGAGVSARDMIRHLTIDKYQRN
jgi:hypothetical protein